MSLRSSACTQGGVLNRISILFHWMTFSFESEDLYTEVLVGKTTGDSIERRTPVHSSSLMSNLMPLFFHPIHMATSQAVLNEEEEEKEARLVDWKIKSGETKEGVLRQRR